MNYDFRILTRKNNGIVIFCKKKKKKKKLRFSRLRPSIAS